MATFQIGAGAGDSPVILHVPHASRHIASDVRSGIVLDDAELAAELDRMTDLHTDVIASRATTAARCTPWSFVNLSSRLVVDPERFPDEREEMRASGMGAVYTRTAGGQKLRDDDPGLLVTYYEPYAAAMTRLVDERIAATGRAVIVDVHSYPTAPLPYELHATGPRPAVCLGIDDAHTPPDLLAAAADAFAPVGDVAVNSPFAGCYVPLKHYRAAPEVNGIMIELRRDSYMTEPGGPMTGGVEVVVGGLIRLIDAVSSAQRR